MPSTNFYELIKELLPTPQKKPTLVHRPLKMAILDGAIGFSDEFLLGDMLYCLTGDDAFALRT